MSKFEVGQALKVEELFNVGDLVDVAGTSTGKGFQGTRCFGVDLFFESLMTLHANTPLFPCAGTIKRWGHARGLMTHGSKSKRQHGSIGQCATPSRVLPGLKMAGQMGNKRTKVKKLKV